MSKIKGELPKLEDCNPGLDPVEFNVLIAVDEAPSVTRGGIIIPENARESERLASMKGLLVEVSPLAFDYSDWPDGSRKPTPGDTVLFAKYGGILVDGDDGRQYRVCKDKDILAVYKGGQS